MIVASVALLVALLAGYLQGGRPLRIRYARLRALPLLLTVLGVQVWTGAGLLAGIVPSTAAVPVLVGLQSLLIVWILLNLDRPGMLLLAVGLGANALVIAVNGGMPVSPGAFAAVGSDGATIGGAYYHAIDASTRLAFLSDVIPLPLLRSVASPGDFLVAIGLVPLMGHLMTSPAPGEVRRPRRILGPAIGRTTADNASQAGSLA